MSVAIVTPESGAETNRHKESVRLALVVLILAYTTVWACTGAHFMADTNVYTAAILNHQYGAPSVDFRLLTSNPFWDFGHILWRPLGWLCFVLGEPVTRFFGHNSERAQVISTLIGLNFLAALACVLFFFQLTRRIIGADWAAAFITFALLSSDAFLNYAHSGSPYVVGLACLVIGMYLSFGKGNQANFPLHVSLAALMYALAVLFWFPYVFVLPAAVAAPVLIHRSDRGRWRFAVQTLLACALVGLVVYGSAVAVLRIRHMADLKDWVLAAGHGHMQSGGTRVFARLAFSVPRSFINMNRDGMWLKRYLVHDPYAPVPFRALFRLSLWKLVLFYASVVIVCTELLRNTRGKILILLLASAVLPVFIFAVFIFEAGSIERYLPLYPFIFVVCGYVLAAEHSKYLSKVLLVAALTTTAAVNVNAMRRGTLESAKAGAISRIQDLVPLLTPNSLVMAVNEQDNLAEFRQNFPLDEINLHGQWQNYDMLEINTERLATWREDFARQVLATWRRGGSVWLPERVFRSKPKPEWNWVEGDDKRINWTDLPAFFSHFDTGRKVGGEDGFVLLDDTARNKGILVIITRKDRDAKGSRRNGEQEIPSGLSLVALHYARRSIFC